MISGQTPGCGEMTSLTAPETRLLASMLSATEPVEVQVFCALEADHAGLHVALGQVSGPDWWWVRWDGTGETRGLFECPPCDVEADPDGPGEPEVPCALPRGHTGAHGFTRPT